MVTALLWYQLHSVKTELTLVKAERQEVKQDVTQAEIAAQWLAARMIAERSSAYGR